MRSYASYLTEDIPFKRIAKINAFEFCLNIILVFLSNALLNILIIISETHIFQFYCLFYFYPYFFPFIQYITGL